MTNFIKNIVTTALSFGVVLTVPGLALAVPAAPQAIDRAPAPDHSPVIDRDEDGRWIVTVGPPALISPSEVASRAAQSTEGTVLHTFGHALSGFAIEGVSANELLEIPGVVSVEPDMVMRAFAQTLPTGIGRIEADQNATANIDGSDERVDVDVAVIDTGVDLDHPDLNVFTSTDCTAGGPFNNTCKDGKGDDGNGHGTHVAGTIGALDNGEGVVGVAPGARIWGVQVLDSNGSGWLSDIIAGIDWVTSHADEIEVANMSLGGTGTSDSFRTAIQNSVAAGVVYVVAAGNDTADVYGDDGAFGTSDDVIPAAYPEVATISALSDTDGAPGGAGTLSSWGGSDRNSDGVDDGEDDSFAFFSNFSMNVVSDNPVNSPGAAVDLLLPGIDIFSTWKDGTYNTSSGTSMASPHGAGLAALYIADNGRASDAAGVYAIRQALIDNGVAQDNADGLAILNDPDSNWEYLGRASTAVGDPPSVAITNPLDGDTISGTISIEADASDSDGNVAEVEFFIDSASIGTDTDGLDGWSVSWDSTSVSDGSHAFEAVATDNDANTASDSILVTVDNVNDAPIADAGEDKTVSDDDGNGSEDVALDGTGSSDPDGAISSYEWYEGGTLLAAGATTTVTLAVGSHTITLMVTDDDGATGSDDVVIDVLDNQLPIADAGDDQTVVDSDGNGSEDVTLDGSGSSDPDGSISSYEWYEGNTLLATGVSPTVTLALGDHTITLIVTDNGGATASDGVLIAVTDEEFVLSATGYKLRGLHKADLEWSGANSTNVDVYRDSALIVTTENDGFYTDNIDQRGSGTYTYQLCEEGTSTCSNESTISF